MSAGEKTFVGFGFGAIQAGLFLYEAFRSGAFGRLVVAEVVPAAVEALRASGGRYRVNVATREGLEVHEVTGVEIYNPTQPGDRGRLVEALAAADEASTALPSVSFYDRGASESVASLLTEALARRKPGHRMVLYAAENHNHAAEILTSAVAARLGQEDAGEDAQFLNTVIGKMSGVVDDPGQAREQGLAPITDGDRRSFLVEAFNRILVTRVRWSDVRRGIAVFEEKPDLLPFEEAKLYGHNATHALIGYLAAERGYRYMSDAAGDATLMELARGAFVDESGAALCRRHAGVDPLFTPEGYGAYVEDLLERMTNPHLRDAVERITRDPRRKLGWDDRLVGTMRVVAGQGLEPWRYAQGAAAALRRLERETGGTGAELLASLWEGTGADAAERERMRALVLRYR